MKRIQDDAAALAVANPNPGKMGSEAKKGADDKKRKNKDSQGVQKLKKTNTSGMSKLSSFFKKATTVE